jgi:TRAP-type C4-dicarboxylate transport system substrate-binding protein
MTPAEVGEIQKMPPTEKRQILLELAEELEQSREADLEAKEKQFVNGLRQKGLVTEIPLRLPDDELRRNFKRIEVKGEPLSETLVKERRRLV